MALSGLTSAEAGELTRQGFVNRAKHSAWADYASIASRHLFTLFNLMVAPAAVALFFLREWQAGVAVSSMATVNTVLGLFQEIRAKRQLDHLAILVETKARVIRDGQVQEIPSRDVVLGETILIRSGDAVIADGVVLEAQFMEVDESLLTGESDPVRRPEGDRLLSGSICVAGEGAYKADKVGNEAFAQSISATARRYHSSVSPMTDIINLIIKVLSFTAIALCALYFALRYLDFVSSSTMVLMVAATITSMVPQGLVLTATVSFTLGAVVMSRRGALVQRLNAVEAMASIDVICTDKTGTLTTNRLRLAELRNLASDLKEDEVRRRLALFATASVDGQNRNIQAICAALSPSPPPRGRGQGEGVSSSVNAAANPLTPTLSPEAGEREKNGDVIDQIPFKSKNRYSAMRIRDAGTEQVFVLGAPEALGIANDGVLELQRQGLRILMFAESERAAAGGRFTTDALPTPLRPLALIALSDELRPEAGDVLQALSAQGIAFKVISGDNPETVRATVAHLNLPLSREPIVTGGELEKATDKSAFVGKHSVFGRVEPKQKVDIVEALQRSGHRVAMIGDGINDVLPIKRADLGIAMGEGSQAAKTVSSLVLENNSFGLLPETIEEGRTIVRNLRRAAKLFLVKNVYSLILILVYATGLLGLPFPYRPQQVTLLNWLVIGIPAFIIALTRERSTSASKTPFLRDVGSFALRTGIVFGVAGAIMLAIAKHGCECEEKAQRTMLLSVLILLGISALLRVLTDGEGKPLAGDRRMRWLALGAIPVYLTAMYWPIANRFFELTMLDAKEWLLVLAVALPAYGLTLLSDRWNRRIV